jgi:hypothetical protein
MKNGITAVMRSALARRATIRHDEQLHEVLIGQRTGRLKIMIECFSSILTCISTSGNKLIIGLTKWRSDRVANLLRQFAIGGAAEDSG